MAPRRSSSDGTGHPSPAREQIVYRFYKSPSPYSDQRTLTRASSSGDGRTMGGKALAAPLGPTGVLPRAGRVDQHPVPKPCAELRHVAILQRRAGIDGRAEDPREDD